MFAEGVRRMMQPDALRRDESLFWSPGRGTDVWAMFQACAAGDGETVGRLIARDPGLARCHYEYRTPLAFAVRENRVEVARLLLAAGADPINSGTPDTLLQIARDRGYTEMQSLLGGAVTRTAGGSPAGEAIAAAIRDRDVAAVRRLLDADPDLVRAVDEGGNQPIHWAVMTRQLDLIDMLLEAGADIEAQRPDGARPLQLTRGDYSYRGWLKDHPTPWQEVLAHLRARGAHCDICTAAYIGDRARVLQLLEGDPGLANRPSDYVSYYPCSGTPLRNAAVGGHLEIVRLLLDRGADPNLPEEGIAPRGSALYSAVFHRHHDVVKLLLERGAHPNAEMESSADALSIALSHEDGRMVDLLCSHGAARPVHLLAHYGDLRTAAAVFAANPALADDPEALGSAGGHEDFVRLMLRYRPDLPRRVGMAGRTRAITELLFAHGMDPSHPNWLHITPLHRFAERGDIERAALFLAHGADVDARDEEFHSTPLGYAAKFGKERMARFLLRHGASPNPPDTPAWAAPAAWARSRGHASLARLLEESAATGAPPALPTRAEYEGLAADLLAACNDGDAAAAGRFAEAFEIDARTWNTGRSTLDEVRRRVREHPSRDGAEDGALGPEAARALVALWDGFSGWAELTAAVRAEDGGAGAAHPGRGADVGPAGG